MTKNDLKFIGVDIGGTTAKIGVTDALGNILYKEIVATGGDISPNIILNKIIDKTRKIAEKFENIKAIGIGLPGIVKNGIIQIAPNLPLWKDFDIENIFRNNFSYPIAIDNDANTAAIAELILGTGREKTNFVYITLGTGVGGAIIIDKKIYKGINGAAGEIGHLIIEYNNNDNIPDFRKGILEEFIGRKSIIELAKKMLENYPNSILKQSDFDVVDISKAAEKNDELARKCLMQIGEFLGIAIANIANLLDITDFIIGGGISAINEIMYENALKTAKNRAIPPIAKHITIEKAHFINDTGIIGAALVGANVFYENSKQL